MGTRTIIARWDVDQKGVEDHAFRMAIRDEGRVRVDEWLNACELDKKVWVQVIGCRDYDGSVHAHAKVTTDSGHFFHDEPYEQFPSDVFKTKVLLVSGGA